MIDTERLKKIRTLQDIQLEKAKLRYEMLLAENRLAEDINVIMGVFSMQAFFESASKMFSMAWRVYSGMQNIFGWIFRRKRQSTENESSD
jgi:hypothetical protein